MRTNELASPRPDTSTPRIVDAHDGLIWYGVGELPDSQDARRACEVMAAVPLAGAAGWSVRGHPWSSHPRRLRTAVVRPSGSWSITQMRGVREVDCLSGPILVRARHIERIDLEPQGADWTEPAEPDVTAISRAMRRAGFRLLLLTNG